MPFTFLTGRQAAAVPVDGELFLKYLNERRATSHVKEEKEDSGKIADLSGTYNDRWKVR